MAISTSGAAVGVARTVELLVPVYAEVYQLSTNSATSVPVTLKRTTDDCLQLAFARLNVRKNVTCVNGASGCHCDFVRFLRTLLMLTERQIVQVDITYVVASRFTGLPPIATLQVHVRVHQDAKRGTSLKEFDFVLCHLQATMLSIVPRNQQARKEAVNSALEDARNSSCHVVGCRLHPWNDAKRTTQPKQKLNLPDVFHSLTSQMEVDQMEIRDDITYMARMTHPKKQIVMTDLPAIVLQNILCLMNARDLSSVSGVCSLFQHMAYEVVPGLNLVLYEHQRRGLKWMLRRENPSLTCIPQPHPFILSSEPESDSEVAIDLIENRVITHPHVTASDACGGMFCDEPGLGKTITMLALILRTKGQTTDNSPVDTHGPGGKDMARSGLRSSRSRGRCVNVEDLVSSGASLLVVPDPLVEHWKCQVEAHVAPGALRVFVDPGVEHKLPYNMDLAQYDVVITSFTRLAREWRINRPTSALEERMPERYGFEGPQRYADGTLRGKVSSLLTVHWVRVIVDEGHKLGGQTPSDLMQLARLLCAKRRWVMTGTPTPNTLQSADLRYMHGLLVFLRNLPYGSPDGQAWVKAIARPFERNEIVGFYRLQHLLSRIMMRHTKESIREILPEPIRRTVFIDPTPSEYAQYNGVAAAVRANLVITNMDPSTPGYQHPDSLLNPINRKEALRVVSNLRSACCGGSAVKVSLAEASRLDTINMLSALNVDGDNMAVVLEYLHKVQQQGVVTECGCCKRKLQLLMIIPCGHLCCADCVEDRLQSVGPSCFRCNAVFDREAFQRLQPGFEFEMVEEDVTLENNNLNPNQNGRHRGHGNQIQQLVNQDQRRNREEQEPRGHGRNRRGHEANGQNGHREPRRALDLTRDIHFIDASKAFYAATRIKELKKEFLRGTVALSGRSSRRQAHHLKAIIFSQFKEHIWHTKVAFAQQGVPTADFIAGLNPKMRMKQLMRFRKDPNVNVLLLTEVGSHGLDLSFVTHIFLMDEIWDKSLEQQVISRAHRMGTGQAVVVEQLWMQGSVESQMLRPRETDDRTEVEEKCPEAFASPLRLRVHEAISPERSPKKPNTGGGTMFAAPSKKRKRHRTNVGDARKAAKGNKNTVLQRKLDYVLNNLRLLGENIVAEAGEVRFYVENERKDVIRQAVHVMPNRGSRASTNSTTSTELPAPTVGRPYLKDDPMMVSAPPLPTVQTAVRPRPQARRVVTFARETLQSPTPHIPVPKRSAPDDIIVIDSSSDEESKDADAEDEKQDDMKAAMMMQNAGRPCAKRRRVVALSSSDDDDEDEPLPSTMIGAMKTGVNGKAKMADTANPKTNAAFIAVIDDDDSDTESE